MLVQTGLSPLLYAIYVREVDLSVKNNCEILQYADDVLFVTPNSIQQGLEQLRMALESIDTFLGDLGLNLSPSRINCVFSLTA